MSVPYENPYIEKILSHPNIWQEEDQIFSQKWIWREFFWKEKLMLEIGTGMGNFFSHYAQKNPEIACVGIELKYKRLFRTYEKCEQKGRDDVILLKIFWQKITDIFSPWEVDELYLLFSDPWPKKWHHKHRVIQDDFLRDVANILSPDGFFLIKTDESSYALWIEEHLMRSPDFSFEKIDNEDPDKKSSPENATEFETMGRKEGSKIASFLCRKK